MALVAWEIGQFKKTYGSSNFAKATKTQDILQDMLDSIEDDKERIKKGNEEAKKLGEKGQPNDLRRKAEKLEQVRMLDPKDALLTSTAANAWFHYGNPLVHGNGCDRPMGIQKAIPLYQQVVAAYPMNTRQLLALGRCYQALENGKDARIWYKKVIDIDGDKGMGTYAKGLLRNLDAKDQARAKRK